MRDVIVSHENIVNIQKPVINLRCFPYTVLERCNRSIEISYTSDRCVITDTARSYLAVWTEKMYTLIPYYGIVCLSFFSYFVVIECKYEVPPALVEPISPKGLRVSIPGKFNFSHCTINLVM